MNLVLPDFCGYRARIDGCEDGTNWYVYCSNNPLNRVDPTGLDPDGAITSVYKEEKKISRVEANLGVALRGLNGLLEGMLTGSNLILDLINTNTGPDVDVRMLPEIPKYKAGDLVVTTTTIEEFENGDVSLTQQWNTTNNGRIRFPEEPSYSFELNFQENVDGVNYYTSAEINLRGMTITDNFVDSYRVGEEVTVDGMDDLSQESVDNEE